MNKIKQEYISILRTMSNIKPSESISRGIGYKFNENGDQVTYYYNVENITTICYDRYE